MPLFALLIPLISLPFYGMVFGNVDSKPETKRPEPIGYYNIQLDEKKTDGDYYGRQTYTPLN